MESVNVSGRGQKFELNVLAMRCHPGVRRRRFHTHRPIYHLGGYCDKEDSKEFHLEWLRGLKFVKMVFKTDGRTTVMVVRLTWLRDA